MPASDPAPAPSAPSSPPQAYSIATYISTGTSERHAEALAPATLAVPTAPSSAIFDLSPPPPELILATHDLLTPGAISASFSDDSDDDDAQSWNANIGVHSTSSAAHPLTDSSAAESSPTIRVPNAATVDYVPVPSNTLHVTGLTREDFDVELYSFLRDKLEPFGEVRQFIPLRSFCRCMVVFSRVESAATAKYALDRALEYRDQRLRVYFGENTSDAQNLHNDDRFLAVPDSEALWLISPPGSPPIGWESVREDGPNKTPHASDLAMALAQLARRGLSPRLGPSNGNSRLGVPVLHSPALRPKLVSYFPAEAFTQHVAAPSSTPPPIRVADGGADNSGSSSEIFLSVPDLPAISVEHWVNPGSDDEVEEFSLDGNVPSNSAPGGGFGLMVARPPLPIPMFASSAGSRSIARTSMPAFL